MWVKGRCGEGLRREFGGDRELCGGLGKECGGDI